MIKKILDTNIFIFFAGSVCLIFFWILLGFGPNLIIGINDIAHHLLTLKISSSSYHFFTPIYDWLWMGGTLVAPNVGHIPFEKLLLFLGFNIGTTLNFNILFFQSTMFIFVFKILSIKTDFHLFERVLSSLILATLPIITTRILYGHTSIYFPALFNILFLWALLDTRPSLFLILLFVFTNYTLLVGPYFQVLFYNIVFTIPVIIIVFHKLILRRILFLVTVYLCSFLFAADFLTLIWKYKNSADMFRDSNSLNLIYSYVKLGSKDLFDLFTFKVLNFNSRPSFQIHEAKNHIGIFPLFFLLYPLYKSKYRAFIFLFGLFLFIFVFCPRSFEVFFHRFPFLNMFRIPQRAFLNVIPLMTLISFFYMPSRSRPGQKLFSISMLFIFTLILVAYIDLLFFDFLLLVLLLLYFLKFFQDYISRSSILLLLLAGNFLYLLQFDQLFTNTKLTKLPENSISLSRERITNSPLWGINTNRFLNLNSIFGYTYPLPGFKKLYSLLMPNNEIDQIYYVPTPRHPRFDKFISTYRYGKNSLTYFPLGTFQTPADFLNNSNASPYSDWAFLENYSQSINTLCRDSQISSESLSNNVFKFNYSSSSICPVIIPFNYSSFLISKVNGKLTTINHANISQMYLTLPKGSGVVEIFPDESLYQVISFFCSILSILVFIIFFRKQLFLMVPFPKNRLEN